MVSSKSSNDINFPTSFPDATIVVVIIIITIIIIIIIIIMIIIIIIIERTHSKTILENTVEIKPQPVALDVKNLSQYSNRSK